MFFLDLERFFLLGKGEILECYAVILEIKSVQFWHNCRSRGLKEVFLEARHSEKALSTVVRSQKLRSTEHLLSVPATKSTDIFPVLHDFFPSFQQFPRCLNATGKLNSFSSQVLYKTTEIILPANKIPLEGRKEDAEG